MSLATAEQETKPSRAALLIAKAAKEELAAEQAQAEEQFEDELGLDMDGYEEGAPADDEDVEVDVAAEEYEAGEGDDAAEDAAEEEFPAEKAADHGSFIRSMLLGGLLGSPGQKRPGTEAGGDAKRAKSES